MSCSIRRSKGLEWVIRHDESGVMVGFKEGNFNDSQDVLFGNIEPNAVNIASIMREIADQAQEVEFISMCDMGTRKTIVSNMSETMLIEAAEKLKGIYWHEDADEFADNIDLINPSKYLREVLSMSTVDQIEELLRLVNSYWVDPYEIDQWAKDVKQMYK